MTACTPWQFIQDANSLEVCVCVSACSHVCGLPSLPFSPPAFFAQRLSQTSSSRLCLFLLGLRRGEGLLCVCVCVLLWGNGKGNLLLLAGILASRWLQPLQIPAGSSDTQAQRINTVPRSSGKMNHGASKRRNPRVTSCACILVSPLPQEQL